LSQLSAKPSGAIRFRSERTSWRSDMEQWFVVNWSLFGDLQDSRVWISRILPRIRAVTARLSELASIIILALLASLTEAP
jgi:hypothetical protein